MQKPCSIEGCRNPRRSGGFCFAHKNRKDKGQDMNAPLRYRHMRLGCTVEGCFDGYHYAKGFCRKHYVFFKKYGDPLHQRKEKARILPCAFGGCKHFRSGRKDYCGSHMKQLKNGKTLLPLRSRGEEIVCDHLPKVAKSPHCYACRTRYYQRRFRLREKERSKEVRARNPLIYVGSSS